MDDSIEINKTFQNLRIVFMGTPEFAVASLEALLSAGCNVVAVVTSPDKPAGRGMKVNESAVKKYAAEKELKIAVIPVGYADGFDRRLGNGIGQIWIKGFFVPLIGNVCMDMCMADVTGFDVNEGDEVEIFGEHISISEIAERIGTIPYEILTGISSRVKRVYIQE